MRFATGFLAAALLTAPAARAQSVGTAIDSLQTTADSLAADATSGSKIPVVELSELRARIEQLDGGVASIPQAERRDYAKSLIAQADLLATARTASDIRSLEIVRDVNADLMLKVQARQLGAANALRGYVQVTVHTKRASGEVRGLVVGANPVALAGAANPMFRFAKLSSPTSRALPPGRYEFLLLYDNVVVSRQRADIGIASSDAIDLDLVVPAGTAPN
nr:hypothetical protein [uncultured Sphingomonas sp.]